MSLAPHKIYAEHCDSLGIQQFYAAIKQPWVVKAALMPDAHGGYSLPIGAVVATEGVIVPSFVGFDQGCGVMSVKTTYDKDMIQSSAQEIFKKVYERVPTGAAVHKKERSLGMLKDTPGTAFAKDILKNEGCFMLGTLGGGNHFIEIGHDEDDAVWITVHSGSRNFGHKIATKYMALAANSTKPEEGMHPLEIGTALADDYILDLNLALDFALENRAHIIEGVRQAIFEATKQLTVISHNINRNHNHAELKDGLWIHRKGATHAELGMMGVVPGNMRDGTFIVRGKGNEESLCSSSHGAGRAFSRKDAKETLSIDSFTEQMTGITAKVGRSTLDESPDAYKDIFKVMSLQSDLVDVVHHLKPMINIKA